MFITIQFPIVDYRYLQEKPLKLARPDWTDPDPDEDSMLYIGKIFNRGIKYKGPWDDEKRYCNAKSVFNFCGIEDGQFRKSVQEHWNSAILFRRFQSDGKFMAKFEIGFYDKFETQINKSNLCDDQLKDDIYKHINDYLLCPVKIKIGSTFSEFVPLIHATRQLANAYFWSTYKPDGKRTFDDKLPRKYVDKGEPSIIVHFDSQKLSPSCLSKLKVELPELEKENISLFHDYIPHIYKGNQNHLKTWFIVADENKSTLPIHKNDFEKYEETIRYLRINLLRIHVEKVILKKIVQKIGKNEEGYQLKDEETEKRVLFHLHKILYNLSKETRNSQSQEKLVEMAFMLEDVSDNGELEQQIIGLKTIISLMEKLNDRNKPLINYTKQIIQNMGDQITVGTITGNLINKSHLVNSLNSAASNGIDEDTKQTLLAIAKKIEDSQNQVAAIIFNQFNEELTKPAPEQNKSKLKQFWDGLVKVMPDVLTIGKSIAGVVALF